MVEKYSYEYPRPALTSDIVLFSFQNDKLKTLLIQRGHNPFAGMWAYPGGFVDEGETAEEAANRELWEETGVHSIQLTQLFTETKIGRDPRGWIVSVVFEGLVHENIEVQAGDDAQRAEWFDINTPPELVFGHEVFLNKAVNRCREQLLFSVFGKELLPDIFSLKTLYKLYLNLVSNNEKVERIVKRLMNKGVLLPVGNLWKFEEFRYDTIKETGFID